MWNPLALRMDRRYLPNLVVGAVHKVLKVALSYLYPDAAPHDPASPNAPRKTGVVAHQHPGRRHQPGPTRSKSTDIPKLVALRKTKARASDPVRFPYLRANGPINLSPFRSSPATGGILLEQLERAVTEINEPESYFSPFRDAPHNDASCCLCP